MTAQVPDALTYNGQHYALFSLPLEPYLAVGDRRAALAGLHRNTACLRGYRAAWSVIDGGLYLTGLSGWWDAPAGTGAGEEGAAEPAARPALTLAQLFPGAGPRIAAEWFSGQLRCPLGQRLRRVHWDFESVYARDLLLEVHAGRLVRVSERTNPAPEPRAEEALEIPAFLRKSPGG